MADATVDKYQDVMDSRDIIARIEELKDCQADGDDEIDAEELKALEELAEEASGSPDWEHGEALIRESCWTEYCQDMLEDCGDLPKDLPWYIHIDWEWTAREIAMDYMTVDFDGIEYLIRA